jgi:WD40 repeat protein
VIWNSELPWMLISGSDDSMIVIWDTRSSKVVTSSFEPTLSLTSFTSHPKRPFTLVSSHFDSSIIMWSLLSLPEVALS